MKKLFTIDDFAISLVSALSCGFSESIARLWGWPELAIGVVSFAVAIVFEEIISKIVFSKAVQKNPKNRVFIYVAFLLIFLLGQRISVSWMGVSMLQYLEEEFAFVVGLPILGFIVNLLIRRYHIWKVRALYGDGSEGFVFDVKNEDIEEMNQQNQPILGEYDTDCAVKTRTGVYVGEKEEGTISYRGIPYAKPPVGERRWKAPEPLPASEAVFEAKNFGASAIQVEQKGAILKHHRQSEDCLSLNVCVGDQKTKKKKPVLVLFHYGDFSYGGSGDPLLYGEQFVNSHPDIVFVSFNYRLGIFGFIDFSEIPGGEAYPDALNLGLLDQIAALKWIKENIAAFGGDPERITVMGFESGAACICMLSACKQAKGLFQKAFVFHGSLAIVYDTPEASRALARDLLKETRTTTMEELSRLETETLKDAAQKLWRNLCAPTCDGTMFPADVHRAYQEGAASGIAFIVGIPSNEMQVFRSFMDDKNYKELILSGIAEIQKEMEGSAFDVTQERKKLHTASFAEIEAKSRLVEQWVALYSYRSAVTLAEGGNQVHLMYWEEEPLIENLGSGTVDAVAALLGNSDAARMYGSVINKDLSEALQSLLVKFINGDALRLYHNEIKGVDAFEWKAFPQALVVSDGEIRCENRR